MELQLRVDTDMATEVKNNGQRAFLFNSTSGVLQFILTTVLIFLSIPVFLKNLGDVQYGIFCTVSVIGNLTIFANLSLDAALIKFLAEQGKCKESNYDIVVMLSLLLVILIPISATLYIFREFILVSILNIPLEYLAGASKLLAYLILSNAILLIGKVFTSILDSLQKIYLSNLAMFLYSTIYWGGVIVVVMRGYGLEEIGGVIFLASVVWLLLVCIMALKSWGRITSKGITIDFKRIVKKQLGYSTKIYTASLLGFLYEPLTKILISNFIGLPAVGIYEIALKIKYQLVSVFAKFLYPIYPMIAQMHQLDKLRYVVNRMTECLYYIVTPMCIMLIFCTKPFISLWIGGDNVSLIAISTIVLAGVTLLFSIPVTPNYYFIRAKNHPGKEIYMQSTNALVSVVVILMLYKHLGFYAILLGNSLSYLASFSLSTYYQHKYLGHIPFAAVKERSKFTICMAIIGIIAYTVFLLFESNSIEYILLEVSVIFITSATLFYVFKVFKKDDLNLIR